MKSVIFKGPPEKKVYRSYKTFDHKCFSNALKEELETLEGDTYEKFEKKYQCFKYSCSYRSSHQKYSVKKVFLKHLRLRPANLSKKTLWRMCLTVNFGKFLRTPFLQNTFERLLLLLLRLN